VDRRPEIDEVGLVAGSELPQVDARRRREHGRGCVVKPPLEQQMSRIGVEKPNRGSREAHGGPGGTSGRSVSDKSVLDSLEAAVENRQGAVDWSPRGCRFWRRPHDLGKAVHRYRFARYPDVLRELDPEGILDRAQEADQRERVEADTQVAERRVELDRPFAPEKELVADESDDLELSCLRANSGDPPPPPALCP
jgi:hypothetical protein